MKNLFLSIVFLAAGVAAAQGCSDAGICSIAGKDNTEGNLFRNRIELVGLFGAGQADVTYFSPQLSYTRQWNRQFALTTRITFNVAQGSFGTRGTFGDAYLIGNYLWKMKNSAQWSSQLGLKFPFTSANLKINGNSLPMDYQASLGTFDLLAGTNLRYKSWDFNAALQVPVFNLNRNSYFREFSGTDAFVSTNLLVRQPDALLRVGYSYPTPNKKFTFRPSLLGILHLGEDNFENIYGIRERIAGSGGLTLNGNLVGVYRLDAKNSIEASVATPFIVREVRPDGLTRSFTAALTYSVSF